MFIWQVYMCAGSIVLTFATGSVCDIFRLHIRTMNREVRPYNLLFIQDVFKALTSAGAADLI